MGILFFLIIGMGYLLGKRKTAISVDTEENEAKSPDEKPSQEELDADAEQKRWHEAVDGYNQNFYYKTGIEASQAFQVAQQIQTLIGQIPPVPVSKKD